MINPLNERVAEIFSRIHDKKPLIHHITNFVVMNDTANLTIHIGASPVMSHAIEEVEEMTAMASALVLNPGTLSCDWVESMKLAGLKANTSDIPVVLDPVGAGATKYRTSTNLDLLNMFHTAVIRGNAGEISALSGIGGQVRGVDSVGKAQNPEKVASDLAKKYKTVVVITGKRDIVTDGKDLYYVENGHELLQTITGSGCMSTAMIGAFVAVEKDFALAAASAMAVYGVAAELAATEALGPASFKVAFMDALYNLTTKQIIDNAKVVKVRSGKL